MRDIRVTGLAQMTPSTATSTRDSADPSPHNLVSPGQPTIGHRAGVIVGVVALVVTAAGIIIVTQSGRPSHGNGVGSATWVLALVSVVATIAYLVVFVALHVLPTGFTPVRHAVSDYGVGRFAPLFRVGLYASSVGVLALAFTLTYLAISRITPVLLGLDSGQWLHGPLRWTAWVVAPELGLVVITMVRPLRKVFGLFERLFLVTTNVWFILVAVLLLGGAS